MKGVAAFLRDAVGNEIIANRSQGRCVKIIHPQLVVAIALVSKLS